MLCDRESLTSARSLKWLKHSVQIGQSTRDWRHMSRRSRAAVQQDNERS
jgi:hypothetical protein